MSPLIEKYSSAFEKDPTSRVFAPLAEGYRKAGLATKAMEILKIGIRNNPSYLQGYISLASCYTDLGEHNLAYTTLRPLISDNRDNIRLQKLFGENCVELGHHEEALESYKYLLFLNPKDHEVSKMVAKIEDSYLPTVEPKVIESDLFEIDEIDVLPEKSKNSLDEWIKVDLKKESPPKKELKDDSSDWKVEKIEKVKPTLVLNPEPEVEEEVKVESSEASESDHEEAPVITHSLVDLYINQGYLTKAKELLLKIIELNPNEAASQKKLDEVLALEGKVRLEAEDEEDGHQRLKDSLDAKLGGLHKSASSDPIIGLQSFLDAIQERSELKKNQQL
ncbi:MAG: tetratricopeptide (TPR) repeat protein [Bacteriovoracaceae bacterium]|jgi:tetratricopeptide (TPR) repeat protein